jgi:starch phosphorylase
VNRYLKFTPQDRKVAYFSMEIGLMPELPIYSGGLGVLAGDTLKSFADLGIPAVGVSLLSEKGYFHQVIDDGGMQAEVAVKWDPAALMMAPLSEKVTLRLEQRTVLIQAWVYDLKGIGGSSVPILFLDTNLEQNAPQDRLLTSYLYGGDRRYRLMQEAVLGIGGVRMLRMLDHERLEAYHMNEGHSALLTLDLMDRFEQDIQKVRSLCVFTTHTPVPAGHDRFDLALVQEVLGEFCDIDSLRRDRIIDGEEKLNMTYLGLHHADYINGVAKRHGETARRMFPQYRIDAITNGVHAVTWTSEAMAAVFDRHIPLWRQDPYCLRNALNMPRQEIQDAHQVAKKSLIQFVNTQSGVAMDDRIMTIGFARRATAYKRPDLLLDDIDRLEEIARKAGPFQVIYGGKAHPADEGGKLLIKKIIDTAARLKDTITIVYMPNYDMYRAKLMVAGCDVWLNTPLPPMEASGTSGMKAALNGVLNFSVLDGWWLEGHIEDLTGWRIGPRPELSDTIPPETKVVAADLYATLESKILPTYYHRQEVWNGMMAHTIALNGSFFNSHRMVAQYVSQAYFR